MSLSESKTYDNDLLKTIFVTFSITFGGSWDKNLATDELASMTKQIWVKALAGLSRLQIEHGLNNLSGQFAIPPHEFRKLCLPVSVKACHKPFPKLLDAPRNKSLARSSLASARRLLREGVSYD